MAPVIVRLRQARPPFTWLVAACLTTIGCDTPALRLVVERDTLVLYGDHFTPLPVKVVDEQGVVSRVWSATIKRKDNSTLTVGGTWVTCLRPGTAQVRLSAKRAVDSIVIDCRAIRAFHPPPDIEMDVNDEPRELSAAATLATGEVVRLEPIDLTIGDSTVVSVADNQVTPLTVGYTSLKINFGGVVASTTARVRETLASGPLELKAGESRQWDLSAGRYDILVIVNNPLDLTSLRMETDGAQCSRSPRNEDLIHCVVHERGSATMVNTSTPPKARLSRAVVHILKTYSR